MFGSLVKDTVKSKWQPNQAVKHMMNRKIKQINQKAEVTQEPKKTFYLENQDLTQKQQMI